MVVIKLNEYLFVNKPWILIPNSHSKTKDNMKLLWVDLYCKKTMLVQKMGLLWKQERNCLEKIYPNIFHINLLLIYFQV